MISQEDEDSQIGRDNHEMTEDSLSNIVYVCGLAINIEMISKNDIKKLRTLMPKKEYT